MLIIPDEFQVDESVLRDVLEEKGAVRETFDLARPQRELTRRLRSEGIEFVDLLGPSIDRAAQEALYKPRNTHWN